MARWPFVSLGRYSRQSISCFVDRAATDAGNTTFLRCITLLYFAIRLESRKSANKRIYLSIYLTVADIAATRKTEKYSTLSSVYRFEPIAVENLGVFSSTTLNFISELGCRICVHTGYARETS